MIKASYEAVKALRKALQSSDEVIRVASAEAIMNHCSKLWGFALEWRAYKSENE